MITQEQVQKLATEDITVKEQRQLLSDIDDRVRHILHNVLKILGGNRAWYSYDNEFDGDGGNFNYAEYKDDIGFVGRTSIKPPFGGDSFGEEFYIPTRWLWSSDEDIIKEYTEETEKVIAEEKLKKEQAKIKRDELKVRKAKMKEIITAKLTKEELKFIKFK